MSLPIDEGFYVLRLSASGDGHLQVEIDRASGPGAILRATIQRAE